MQKIYVPLILQYLMNSILIVLPILTLLMFDIGLTLTAEDFRLILHRPKPVIAGLLGQIVCLPLLAFLLAYVVRVEPIFALGIVLIACCPGGSSSNVFSMLAGGDVALSVSLTALSSLITLMTIPIVLEFTCQAIPGLTETAVQLPVGNLIMQNIVLSLVPIIIGLLIRRQWANIAKKIHRVMSKIAFPAIILLATIFFIQHRVTIGENIMQLGLLITVLILLAMLSGWLLSKTMRLNEREKKTIVIEVGMQNAAQAIAIASSPFVFANSAIAIPAIIYALMMNVILILYVALKRRKKA